MEFAPSDPRRDAGFAGSGSRGTANILAAAIKKTGADVAFFGKQAIDGDTGLTPVMAARALGMDAIDLCNPVIKSVR